MSRTNFLARLFLGTLLIITAGMLFWSAGLGLLADRMKEREHIEASAVTRERAPTDAPLASPRQEEALEIASAPENFVVFWETYDKLVTHYDGDVPRGNQITFAAVSGLMEATGECNFNAPQTDFIQIDAPPSPAQAPENFAYFWQTVNQLYADCGSQVPAPDGLVYAAVDGVLESLEDRYTALLPPTRADQFRIDLESSFEGIGATVAPIDFETGLGVVIVYPFPGSPAEAAGLLPDDVILSVDTVDVTRMDLNEAVTLIRGPAGSKVVLTIRRSQENPFTVEITRDRIDIPILESQVLSEENLLYVVLRDFSSRATSEMREALRMGEDAGVDGVILDLRGNPGGRLDVSIEVASMFISEGVIVSESGRRNIDHEATGRFVLPDVPLAVLIDGGSASASEIVAGAIQDYGRGVLVGEPSFGKGSVQSIFDLSDGSLLRVTSARWYTPLGRKIDGEGLQPDVEVSPPEDPHDGDADPQLQAAIAQLQEIIASHDPAN